MNITATLTAYEIKELIILLVESTAPVTTYRLSIKTNLLYGYQTR